jgi:hypothetical protein
MYRNVLIAAAAVLALSAAPALAQSADANAAAGGAAGGVAGAVAGGLIFGPIGAVIGGFTGATIGAEAGISAADVDYVRLHPTEPVVIEGDVGVGYVVPEDVTIQVVQDDPKYGYFYTKDRVYFVDLSDRKVVYSPGVVVAGK